MIEIFLGQIPEAIYFAIFMILAKEIKSKRIVFTLVMIIEYVALMNLLPYSMWSHVLYFVLSYIVMKLLYPDDTHIIDVFTFGIASLLLVPISAFSYFATLGDMSYCAVVSRILMLCTVIMLQPLLPKLNRLYKKLWNRGKHNYKMKSTTFRALNLVIFNFSFVLINLGLIFHTLYWR